jgi:hypothetical protein
MANLNMFYLENCNYKSECKDMTISEIGCCGAYCKTCIEQQQKKYPNERGCRGCKLGYESDSRDLSRAKCKIKVCCLREKHLVSCADCLSYPCGILEEFWSKKGWKYQQCMRQLEFIRQSGYEEFLKRADGWRGPRGKL